MSLEDLVGCFPEVRALVVGDPMIDAYHFGRVDRLSPEAPVPIFLEHRVEDRQGGAANVAEQLQELGVSTHVFFPAGMSVKHRYLVGHQILFRHDFDHIESPSDERIEALMGPWIPAPHVVVLSDYAKGWLTPTLCEEVIVRARSLGIPVVVDPKGTAWTKYAGATVICPNAAELAAWWESVKPAAAAPLGETQLLVKRGAQGLRLLPPDFAAMHDYPAQARHVFDVTGAGDTVIALVAAVLGAGGDLPRAAELANLAAGYVVAEVGTAVCPRQALLELARARDAALQVPTCRPAR